MQNGVAEPQTDQQVNQTDNQQAEQQAPPQQLSIQDYYASLDEYGNPTNLNESSEPDGETPANQDSPTESEDSDRPLTYSDLENFFAQQQELKADPNLARDAELARKIYENPQALEAVKNALQEKEEESSFQEEPYPDIPKAPIKPAGFNAADAAENPDGPSARYLNEFQTYQEEMIQWNAEVAATTAVNQKRQREHDQRIRAEEAKRQAELYHKQQQEQTQKQQILEAHNTLKQNYQMSDENASGFLNEYLSGTIINDVDFIVQAWLAKKGNPQNQPAQAAPPAPQVEPQPTSNVRPQHSPAATATGGIPANPANSPNNAPVPKSDVDIVANHLLLQKRARDARLF